MDKLPYYAGNVPPGSTKRKRISERQTRNIASSETPLTDGTYPPAEQAGPGMETSSLSQSVFAIGALDPIERERPVSATKFCPEVRPVVDTSAPTKKTSSAQRTRVSKRQLLLRTNSVVAVGEASAEALKAKHTIPCKKGYQALACKEPFLVSPETPIPPNNEPQQCTGQPESSSAKRKRLSVRQGLALTNSAVDANAGPKPKKRRGKGKTLHTAKRLAASTELPLLTGQHMLPDPETCQKCGARKFLYESVNFCCGNGAVRLPLNAYPPQLEYLYTSSDELAQHFQKYARLYNNVFAYSSIGGTFDVQTLKGIYVFKLQGQMYHYVPDLLPTDGGPRYLQLYFYDGQHEAERRAGCLPELRRDVVDILMEITDMNPYAKFFRSLREVDIQEDTVIVINKNARADQRVYNAPTSDEVAVIWSEQSASGETSGPHIMVTGKSQKAHRILHFFGCYDPLQYPLLFPFGESGWHQGLKKFDKTSGPPNVLTTQAVSSYDDAEQLLEDEPNRHMSIRTSNERHVSCREYYCFRFQIRIGHLLLRAGRCLQQYTVDMYVKLENTRLDFFRNNQDTIRAELYQGLLDTVEAGESSAANVGRRVVLPANFIGGPRDMKRRYLNSMSLVQRYGKPDLFITMTCNPNWPEIKRELAPGEEAHNRPDIVARVFRAKLVALKKQIMENHVFGEVAAFIYVVEFQKRGLPHVHFLVILKPAFKINGPADFDKFVSTEIPPASAVGLRASVLKHMMHGPCGSMNPECQCMHHPKTKGQCKYGYPKAYSEETTHNSDGYPEYRRRNTRETVKVRKHDLDNRWVIPYNPYLMALFDCHLNVEVCSTIQAVKYLYKYVYKGHDKISFNVTADDGPKIVDEIERFQSGRWVSPCEAMWRIYGFDLYEMQPAVMPLQIHLSNMQSIQMRPHENLQTVLANEKRSRTPLTEFFRIYNNDTKAKIPKYLYGEFPEYYRWDTGDRTWFKRKTKLVVIGRLVFVAPAEGERFFLRMLLQNVRGPKSFTDLKTVDGICCETFQEAALKLRLLEADNTVEMCLDEAAAIQMPSSLRHLFATLLIFCQPKEPAALWERYLPYLSEDYVQQFPGDLRRSNQRTYEAIEQVLEAMGRSMKAFGLDGYGEQLDAEIHRTRDIEDALDAPIPDECIACISSLNKEQQHVFDTIMEHVKDDRPGAFFVDGPGGTGKTYLYNALYANIRLMGKIVLPTATSGIAASNIPSGRTTHSRFKLPVDLDVSLSCDVPKQGSLAALLRAATLLIWDEASMARKENIESLDTLLRDLCDPDIIFGGKLIVFGGDFRQILPVVPQKSNREIVGYSLVSSKLWPQLTKFSLTENIRAKQDPAFANFLLALGNGELQTQENEYIELPTGIVRYQDDENIGPLDQITELGFPRDDPESYKPESFTTRAILTPMNEDVDAINSILIDRFPGTPTTYKSYDTVLDDKCNIYPTEFINQLCPGGMSPHELILKVDSPVILLRNLLPSSGLCNGTRLICKTFTPNLVGCVITSGHYAGKHVFIPRINLRPPASANYPFQFQRKQFPIKLSFAMTINKSQGQTLDKVAIYLPRPCFSPGQLYVALSRAKKAENVSVVTAPLPQGVPRNSAKNIISYEVLRLAGIN